MGAGERRLRGRGRAASARCVSGAERSGLGASRRARLMFNAAAPGALPEPASLPGTGNASTGSVGAARDLIGFAAFWRQSCLLCVVVQSEFRRHVGRCVQMNADHLLSSWSKFICIPYFDFQCKYFKISFSEKP